MLFSTPSTYRINVQLDPDESLRPNCSNASLVRFAQQCRTAPLCLQLRDYNVPKGSWEIENWVALERSPLHDNDYDTWLFRHEVEYGVTDHFQIAVYVANWDFAPRGGEEEEEAEGAEAVESDQAEAHAEADEKPHRRPILQLRRGIDLQSDESEYGLARLGRIRGGELRRSFRRTRRKGPAAEKLWAVAIVYNAIVEFEWEGAHLEGEKIEFAQTFGVSYQVHPKVAVGGELVHEIAFPDFNKTNAERRGALRRPEHLLSQQGLLRDGECALAHDR
jgi:hypothetical protein